MEKNRKPILQPNKKLVIPKGQAANAINAGAKTHHVSFNAEKPEDGIMAVLRSFMALTGVQMPSAPELARALGAAYRIGLQHAIMSHHVNVLNTVVRTPMPNWINPKSEDEDQKQLVKAIEQIKNAIVVNMNKLVEKPKPEKQQKQNPKENKGDSDEDPKSDIIIEG
jgi:hypothetical protein